MGAYLKKIDDELIRLLLIVLDFAVEWAPSAYLLFLVVRIAVCHSAPIIRETGEFGGWWAGCELLSRRIRAAGERRAK